MSGTFRTYGPDCSERDWIPRASTRLHEQMHSSTSIASLYVSSYT